MSRAARTVTDRALRYRANQAIPEDAPQVCSFCGSSDVEVGHIDGREENSGPENLTWTCRPCNVRCANTLRAAGAGRLTNQFNPAGARSAQHYRNAVETLLGLSRAMGVRGAIETMQGTSHHKRAEYAHKRNPGADTLGAYMAAIADHKPGAHDAGGRVIHATPKAQRSRFAREIARIKKARYGSGDMPDWVTNPGRPEIGSAPLRQAKSKKDFSIKWQGQVIANMYAESKAAAIREFKRTRNTDMKVTAVERRGNPAGAARDAYERFHGERGDRKLTIIRKLHEHEHVAAIGELLELWIVPRGQETAEGKKDKCIVLKDFDGAWLTQNEDIEKPQLFIDGGDQVVDARTLRECGIKPGEMHEWECLGTAVKVVYFTTKTHLGKEGGEADYHHEFGETRDAAGRRVFTGKASRPLVQYDTVNQLLFISGGKYTIPPEGISN